MTKQAPYKVHPVTASRLHLLASECADVIKAISKVLEYGGYAQDLDSNNPDWTNQHNLESEIGHVTAVIELMRVCGDLNMTVVHRNYQNKWNEERNREDR